jgi:hypothetical protein
MSTKGESLSGAKRSGLGLDDDECGAPVSPHSAQPSPEEPVEWGQLRLLYRAMQNAQLVPERKIFQLGSGSGFEG